MSKYEAPAALFNHSFNTIDRTPGAGYPYRDGKAHYAENFAYQRKTNGIKAPQAPHIWTLFDVCLVVSEIRKSLNLISDHDTSLKISYFHEFCPSHPNRCFSRNSD